MSSNINDSNEKAKLTASLGLCHVNRSKGDKVIGGNCPAADGQIATVKFFRHPSSIQITSCRHQAGKMVHTCEAYQHKMVCYHAKAVLIQSANEKGFDIEFSNAPVTGATPLFVHPGKIIYMSPVKKNTPKVPPPDEPVVIPKKNKKTIKKKKP